MLIVALSSSLCLPRLSMSPKVRKIIGLSTCLFLGTSKRWYLSILPYSSVVIGQIKPSSGCLIGTVTGTSSSPANSLPPFYKIVLRSDKPRHWRRSLSVVIVPFPPFWKYLTHWWYVEATVAFSYRHSIPRSTLYDVSRFITKKSSKSSISQIESWWRCGFC